MGLLVPIVPSKQELSENSDMDVLAPYRIVYSSQKVEKNPSVFPAGNHKRKVWVFMHAYMYVYKYVCMYVCMCTHIYV